MNFRKLAALATAAGLVAGGWAAFRTWPASDKEHARAQLRKLRRRGLRSIRRRGHGAKGLLARSLHPRWAQRAPEDDATLKTKVETILFQPPAAPKGLVSVNVDEGVVYLRGQLISAAVINDLEQQARQIPGVRGVVNLLHLPGTPVPDSNNFSPHPLLG